MMAKTRLFLAGKKTKIYIFSSLVLRCFVNLQFPQPQKLLSETGDNLKAIRDKFSTLG
jgi:hypothetical protein